MQPNIRTKDLYSTYVIFASFAVATPNGLWNYLGGLGRSDIGLGISAHEQQVKSLPHVDHVLSLFRILGFFNDIFAFSPSYLLQRKLEADPWYDVGGSRL